MLERGSATFPFSNRLRSPVSIPVRRDLTQGARQSLALQAQRGEQLRKRRVGRNDIHAEMVLKSPLEPWAPRVAALRQDLIPKVAAQGRVVGEPRAVAPTGVRERRPAHRDLPRPFRRPTSIVAGQELIRRAVGESVRGRTGQDHAVGGLVGIVVVRGDDVNEAVPSPRVVLAEVQVRGQLSLPRARRTIVSGGAQLMSVITVLRA